MQHRMEWDLASPENARVSMNSGPKMVSGDSVNQRQKMFFPYILSFCFENALEGGEGSKGAVS